jgi:hypothetical protein
VYFYIEWIRPELRGTVSNSECGSSRFDGLQ